MLELLERLIEHPSLLQRPLFAPLARLLSLALGSDALRGALETAAAVRGGRGGEAGAAVAVGGIVTRHMARSAAPPESAAAAKSVEAEAEAEPEPEACDDDGGDGGDADDADSDDDAEDVLGSGARSRAAAEHARQVDALVVTMPTRPAYARQIVEQFTLKARSWRCSSRCICT